MSIYRFVLGFIPLSDDREAVAFGETVVRKLVEDDPTPHTGTVMVVTEGAHEHTVEEISLAVPTMWSKPS